MNYEKAYKEALERANIIYTGKYKSEIAAWTKKSLEAIFPELAESKDKGINIGVKEPPSKTFPRVNEFEEGASYRH